MTPLPLFCDRAAARHVQILGRHTRDLTDSHHSINDNEDGNYDDDDDSDDAPDDKTLLRLSAGSADAAAVRLI